MRRGVLVSEADTNTTDGLLDQLKEASQEFIATQVEINNKVRQIGNLKYDLSRKLKEVIPTVLRSVPLREISLGKNWMITQSGVALRVRTGMDSSAVEFFTDQIDGEVLEPLREQLPALLEEIRNKVQTAKEESLALDPELETLSFWSHLLGSEIDQ